MAAKSYSTNERRNVEGHEFERKMRNIIEPPPRATIEPVVDVLHGTEIPDPYRWLEVQESSRTRQWLKSQTSYARTFLGSIPGRERLRNRIRELLSINTVDCPQIAGNRIFFLNRSTSSAQATVTMRNALWGPDITLIDPSSLGNPVSTSLGILSISGDGTRLAISVRRGGEDPTEIRIFDVDKRLILPERLPRGFCRGLVFSRDSDGFFYSHVEANGASKLRLSVYWHSLGSSLLRDAEVFSVSSDFDA